jgi:two-component sensor histidine kinase
LAQFGEAGLAVLRHDWAGTPLGALERWSPAMAALTEATLASPLASALAFGPQRILICNGSMARLLGKDARDVEGRDAADVFAVSWPPAAEAFESAFAGEIVKADSQIFEAVGGEAAIVDVRLICLFGLGEPEACVQAQIAQSLAQVVSADSSDERGNLEDLPLLAWSAATDGQWLWASRQWTAHTGLSAAESRGFGWLQGLHTDDRERVRELWLLAQHNGVFQCDGRLYDKRRDVYEWRRTCAIAINAGEGDAVEWLAVSIGIDDLWTAKERQSVALAESRRRMRNTFGIVRSIARRTAETSESVETYAMHFEGRLDALARVGGLVAESPPGVALDTLIADELMSFKVREDARFEIAGPPLRIRPEAAEMVGLAIHELATNAVKFGALSPVGGRLEITWRLTAGEPETLVLSWIESGVTVDLDEQRANGFGVDLVKRGLAYALNARTQFNLEAGGLSCTIEFPAHAVVA